eukprot:GILJ01003921.1.p1 GENE.GILJ01003921.1~~GILJ01003921.1.p1  ORF type:complete len:758 (+),score=110.72 GILJ01003921.1:290-2275(+)
MTYNTQKHHGDLSIPDQVDLREEDASQQGFVSVNRFTSIWDLLTFIKSPIVGGAFTNTNITEWFQHVFDQSRFAAGVLQEQRPSFSLMYHLNGDIPLDDFAQSVIDALPSTYEQAPYSQFIRDFGSEVLIRTVLGGLLELTVQIPAGMTRDMNGFDLLLSQAASEFDSQFYSKSVQLTPRYESNRLIHSKKIYGGDSTVTDVLERIKTFSSNPVLLTYSSVPITQFIADPIKRVHVQRAIAWEQNVFDVISKSNQESILNKQRELDIVPLPISFKSDTDSVTETPLNQTAVVGPNTFFNMDINGDHLQDLLIRLPDGTMTVYLSDSRQLNQVPDSLPTDSSADMWVRRMWSMDVNGDGKMDLVIRNPLGNLVTLLSTGSRLYEVASTSTGWNDLAGWNVGNRVFPLDANGDSMMDMIGRAKDGNIVLWLSLGNHFSLAGQTPFGWIDEDGWSVDQRIFVVDANGDGKQDLLGINVIGTVTVWISRGRSFEKTCEFNSTWTDAGDWKKPSRLFTGDFNGDGKTDIVSRDPNGLLMVYVSTLDITGRTGSYVYVGQVSTDFTDANGFLRNDTILVTDVNGDGRMDLVGRYSTPNTKQALQVYLSTGASFVRSYNLNVTDLFPTTLLTDYSYRLFVTDINGDSMADLLWRDNNGSFIPIFTQRD